MNTSIAQRISEYIYYSNFDQLPQNAIHTAKNGILDCVGVMIAGSGTSAGKIIRRHVLSMGSEQKAALAGGSRASPVLAALANGTMAHSLLYDDNNGPMIGHPSSPLVPVLLSAAQIQESTGRDVLLAYALGFEVQVVLARALQPEMYEKGWHATSILGVLGAAAAAGKLLHLSPPQISNAMAIAASLASGIRQNFGTMAMALHVGHAAEGGLTAALLAREGFTGDQWAIEGDLGYSKLFTGQYSAESFAVLDNFGKPWELIRSGIQFKCYPTGYPTHTAIEAILALRNEYSIHAEHVEKIVCYGNKWLPKTLIRDNPTTPEEAKVCLPYCIAVALQDGEVGLPQLLPARVNDPGIHTLMKKIQITLDSELDDKDGAFPSILEVHLSDGSIHRHRVDTPLGTPERPIPFDKMLYKFKTCCNHMLLPSAVDELAILLSNLEQQNHLQGLQNLIGG